MANPMPTILERAHIPSCVVLKPKQSEAILAAKSRDTIVVLPTGYGKTIIIQCLPFLEASDTCTIITAPLNVIVAEQVEKYGSRALRIGSEVLQNLGVFGPEPDFIHKLKNRQFMYLVGHPEDLVDDRMVRYVYRHQRGFISHLVMDEAHCLLTWGLTEFRSAFMEFSRLRSVLPKAIAVALTATATQEDRKEIARLLRMDSPITVAASPDRPNIFLECVERLPSTGTSTIEDSMEDVLKDVKANLRAQGTDSPKTLIFTKLKWCGFGHSFLTSEAEIDNQLVAQYHAPQTNSEKKRIAEDIRTTTGAIRCVLASDALTMGVDIPDARIAIFAGCPGSMEYFTQALGRVGRDGLPATATVYFNKNDIGKNVKYMTETMRKYVTTNTCRRKILLEYFDFPGLDTCNNCDVCVSAVTKVDALKTTLKPIANVKLSLMSYFENVNSQTERPLAEAYTGLSKSVAIAIATSPNSYNTEEQVRSHFPDIVPDYAANIVQILDAFKTLSLSANLDESDSDGEEGQDIDIQSETDSDV